MFIWADYRHNELFWRKPVAPEELQQPQEEDVSQQNIPPAENELIQEPTNLVEEEQEDELPD